MNFAQLARSIVILMAATLPIWLVVRLLIGYRKKERSTERLFWSRELFLTAFVIYCVVVVAMTIAPTAMSLNTDAGFNLVPFRTLVGEIADVQSGLPGSRAFLIANWVGNILLLFPLGVFFPILSSRFRATMQMFLAGLAASSFIEITQYLSQFLGSYRVADTDDVILNTLGACLGFWVFGFGQKFFQRMAAALPQNEAA